MICAMIFFFPTQVLVVSRSYIELILFLSVMSHQWTPSFNWSCTDRYETHQRSESHRQVPDSSPGGRSGDTAQVRPTCVKPYFENFHRSRNLSLKIITFKWDYFCGAYIQIILYKHGKTDSKKHHRNSVVLTDLIDPTLSWEGYVDSKYIKD